MSTQVPTVNDLRGATLKVKLCYICREEENADSPQDPNTAPRAWTHPCSCTLIAHEQCLLKWIQSSQSNASRAPNALKCPQCGTQYEMESDRPFVLKFLSVGNKVLQKCGRWFTVFGAAAAVGLVGTTVYVCLTGYGAWALEKFLGKELFDLILTDDPTNWPWSAYINLPLLPISLILSRFQTNSTSLVIPLLLFWPPTSPVTGERSRRLQEYWSNPQNSSLITSGFNSGGLLGTKHHWPPPPILFGLVGLPFVRAMYQNCYAWAYSKLLGTHLPAPRRPPRGGLRFNEGPFVIRIRANLDGVEGGNGDDGQGEGGGEDGQPPPVAAPGAADQNAGVVEPNPDPNAAAVEAAEQLIEINASSLGRRIGGALIIPVIANSMGQLLLSLSKHSKVLRLLLGIRQHQKQAGSSGMFGLPPWERVVSSWVRGGNKDGSDKPWAQLNMFQQARLSVRLFMALLTSSSTSWVDNDPVWWRNGVGFGLFVVVKDCIQLLHLWLAKRELETRRVKDRDFKGVDIRELDLLPSFFQRAT
ncbi:putative RING finger protein C32F12.07c [Psilocybe cubensis]|uniref:RING-CH-type domain-containing protein n=2 Tax=Psilocybe cubensis TaxID=181762 RepID=A0A8H7XYA9_PSICU|nr:putative RING finger protein C32F12.07c [Psilocybe cubensis]KAH9476883.1 putative RING finger protein C32F12.07c [Psilocybe cubensis]